MHLSIWIIATACFSLWFASHGKTWEFIVLWVSAALLFAFALLVDELSSMNKKINIGKPHYDTKTDSAYYPFPMFKPEGNNGGQKPGKG